MNRVEHLGHYLSTRSVSQINLERTASITAVVASRCSRIQSYLRERRRVLLQDFGKNLTVTMTRKLSNKKGGHSRSHSHHGTSKPKPQAQKIESSTEAQICPYHHSILHLEPFPANGYGLSPMRRFITEPSSEQSSLFLRPDTGKLSTSKDCLCGTNKTAEKQGSEGNGKSEGAYGAKGA